MKIRAIYSHRLKTSRRFVFENIMDLEHVCSLHWKWFRNLRIRIQRPDYVEYRLTSLFHGLSQELLVRGGPVDENHYWYEFIGYLGKIRVDGELVGADGDLTQTERITYEFRWFLAPFFWMLNPLFRRQKNDILDDDSALLERVYELERSGFKRLEPSPPRVVIYGGDGFFGRLAVGDLLAHSDFAVAIASRSPDTKLFPQYRNRVKFYESDLNDYGSVLATIEKAQVVINCAGPFQGMTLNLLRACIEKRVHYIDVGDDRDYVQRAYALEPDIKLAGIVAFVGCSVVPGLSSLLTEYCRAAVQDINATRIFITPGTKNPRGHGSFACLLATVGKQFQVPCNGGERTVTGWSEREQVEFPPPIGRRSVYSVVNIADYWTQQHYFGVGSVHFKIGSEMELLNRLLTLLRWIKQALRFKETIRLLSVCRALLRLAAPFGTTQGALIVEAIGKQRLCSMSVYAAEHGEVIPSLLPSIAAQMIVAGELNQSGIVALPSWISLPGLVRELEERNIHVARRVGSAPWEKIVEAGAVTVP